MENKFTLEYADGYYIVLNGIVVIDFPNEINQNYLFCDHICALLNSGSNWELQGALEIMESQGW